MKRRDSYGTYRFVAKSAIKSTSTTTAVGAGAAAIAPSAGIIIPIQPRQAIWIRRYSCTIVESAVFSGNMSAIGGAFEIQFGAFGNVNGIVNYPLMEAFDATRPASLAGAPISNVGLVFALVDEWFEYDDVAPEQLAGKFQLQSLWVAQNVSAGAINVAVAEKVSYDLYDGQLTD